MISAKANAADRCKSTLSENASVERARSGSPSKKLVSLRSVERSVFIDQQGVVSTHFQENGVVLQWHLVRCLAIKAHKDLSDFVLHGVGQWGSFESMSSVQHLTSKAVLTARRTTRNVSHGEWCLLQTKREGSRRKIR